MKKIVIRNLEPSEIQCRVDRVTTFQDGNGTASIVMYKDARVDQKILDELFGPFGWQREHQVMDGRVVCTISIWDEENRQWVKKQDVGAEGNFEKEKSEFSDAFKRAAFNIGIGRNLYSAPKVNVRLDKSEIYERNGKPQCRPSFSIGKIYYEMDSQRNPVTGGRIMAVDLIDDKGNYRGRFENK